MKRRKLWVGLSTAILVAPTAAAAEVPVPRAIGATRLAQAHGERGHGERGAGERGKAQPVKAKAAASGEGGEGGEGGGARLVPGLRLARGLGLIRGHLLVGDELVQAGRWPEALPHFLHPSEEVYSRIRGDLGRFGVAPFDGALKALAQTVKAKNKEAYGRAHATLSERLAAADRAVSAKEGNAVLFTLQAALELLKSAAEEYERAIKGARIANAVEYQDARGFVLEADRMIRSVAGDLATKNADAARAVQGALSDLKQAWPSVQPPKAPVKDVAAVLADVSRVELQLGNFR